MSFCNRHLEETMMVAPALFTPQIVNAMEHNKIARIRNQEQLDQYKKEHSGFLNNYKNYNRLDKAALRGLIYGGGISIPVAAAFSGGDPETFMRNAAMGGMVGTLSGALSSFGPSLNDKMERKAKKFQKRAEEKKDILSKIERF